MILYSRWVALSLATRNKLAEIFGIVKKGATEVSSNVIRHDGYTVEDIEAALTKDAMEKYLGLMFATPELLWEALINKVEDREVEGGTPLAEAMSTLPAKEAKQFKKEHKARVAKTKTAVVKASVKPKAPKKTKKNGK